MVADGCHVAKLRGQRPRQLQRRLGINISGMGRPKEEMRRLVEALPEDASFEDLQYEIYVRQAVEHGIEAADRGEVLEQEEVERRMAKWLGE